MSEQASWANASNDGAPPRWVKSMTSDSLETADLKGQAKARPLTSQRSQSGSNTKASKSGSQNYVIVCRTEGIWEGGCDDRVPDPVIASAYDFGFGVWAFFDGESAEYKMRWVRPDGTYHEARWALAGACGSQGYIHWNYLTSTCTVGGIYQAYYFQPVPGMWTMQIWRNGVLEWSKPVEVKAATIEKLSGDSQTAPIGQSVQSRVTYSLRHFDGALVWAPIRSESPEDDPEIEWVIDGPRNAGGSVTPSLTDYPPRQAEDEISVSVRRRHLEVMARV